MRPRLWLQLLTGWLPVGGLFVVLILSAHSEVRPSGAVAVAIRMTIIAALLGAAVHRFVRSRPWPERVTLRFAAVHTVASVVFAAVFVGLNIIASLHVHGQRVAFSIGAGLGAYAVLGIWLYVMIAGISYATDATARAARAESAAAQAQLAALRAQLNPHFLFNALHTVVHLIPREPARAAKAAEEVAGLLRVTLEENRDLVTLREELSFVRRYLAVEAIRFAERLVVREDIEPAALEREVPMFAVQTLVENAVRHGASPNIHPTTIDIRARSDERALTIIVSDDGVGISQENAATATGTGLRRLRERLDALYDGRATLAVSPAHAPGFTVTITLPHRDEEP